MGTAVEFSVVEDFGKKAPKNVTPGKSQDGQYVVVTRTLVGSYAGVLTWTTYASKAAHDEWYKGTMKDGSNMPLKDVYEVVAEGITPEEAVEMMRSPDNRSARRVSFLEELIKMTQG